jgi:hypothetical protein
MALVKGQEVVCVDASKLPPAVMLKQGAIYTIAMSEFPHFGLSAVLIEEVYSEGLWAHRFSPIVKCKTDIEIFKRMLMPSAKVLEEI